MGVHSYTLHRRDRVGRRGGGVAVYARSSLHASRWSSSVACLSALEIDWVPTRDNLVFVAAVYYPPRPTYKPDDLLSYVETTVAEISRLPLAEIVLAVDLNQL